MVLVRPLKLNYPNQNRSHRNCCFPEPFYPASNGTHTHTYTIALFTSLRMSQELVTMATPPHVPFTIRVFVSFCLSIGVFDFNRSKWYRDHGNANWYNWLAFIFSEVYFSNFQHLFIYCSYSINIRFDICPATHPFICHPLGIVWLFDIENVDWFRLSRPNIRNNYSWWFKEWDDDLLLKS